MSTELSTASLVGLGTERPVRYAIAPTKEWSHWLGLAPPTAGTGQQLVAHRVSVGSFTEPNRNCFDGTKVARAIDALLGACEGGEALGACEGIMLCVMHWRGACEDGEALGGCEGIIMTG